MRARPQERQRLVSPSVPGLLLQHLADPSLPTGTTLEGLAWLQGQLRPVLNNRRTGRVCFYTECGFISREGTLRS